MTHHCPSLHKSCRLRSRWADTDSGADLCWIPPARKLFWINRREWLACFLYKNALSGLRIHCWPSSTFWHSYFAISYMRELNLGVKNTSRTSHLAVTSYNLYTSFRLPRLWLKSVPLVIWRIFLIEKFFKNTMALSKSIFFVQMRVVLKNNRSIQLPLKRRAWVLRLLFRCDSTI